MARIAKVTHGEFEPQRHCHKLLWCVLAGLHGERGPLVRFLAPNEIPKDGLGSILRGGCTEDVGRGIR